MGNRGPAGMRAGEWAWVWSKHSKDASSFSSEVSGKVSVEIGVPHVIAVKDK